MEDLKNGIERHDMQICIECHEPRRLNQFRKRHDGVTRRSRCRCCTRKLTAQAKAQEAQA